MGSNDEAEVESVCGEHGIDLGSVGVLDTTPALVFCCINNAKAAANPDALVPLLVDGSVDIEELRLEVWAVDALVCKESFDIGFEICRGSWRSHSALTFD